MVYNYFYFDGAKVQRKFDICKFFFNYFSELMIFNICAVTALT